MKKLTIQQAEEMAGKRLDRRRKYYLSDYGVCYFALATTTCTGCFEAGEYGGMAHLYPWDSKNLCRIGSGCEECGYTGKRRGYYPVFV